MNERYAAILANNSELSSPEFSSFLAENYAGQKTDSQEHKKLDSFSRKLTSYGRKECFYSLADDLLYAGDAE